MNGKKILNEMAPYQQGKQSEEIMQEYNLDRVVKLASNENPFGYSKKVKAAFADLNHLEIYPDGYTAKLRSKLAKKLNVEEQQLVFGSGSDELIQIITRTYLFPGANTVMAKPTFTQYKQQALIEGAEIREVPTNNGYHDLSEMLQSIDANTKVVWICNPDNPSGTYIPKEDFIHFMEKCPADVLVVLDEAYIEFVDEHVNYDSTTYLKDYHNLLILRTFSKAYGLAGIRMGYGITHQHITRNLDIVRGPFNTSAIAQNLASVAVDDEEFIRETVTENKNNKSQFEAFLNKLGWKFYESQTNFLLIHTPISGTDVFQYLLENGFIIRPGELLGYPNTIRVTIGSKKDMKELQDVLLKLEEKLNKEV